MLSSMEKRRRNTNYLVKVSLLAALSAVLMFISVPVPIFPTFLKIDLSDLPAVIGVMALGPMAGFFIQLVKNIINVLATQSGGIGEIANFIVGIAFVIPLGYVYRIKKNVPGYVLGALAGVLCMVVIACIFNYYVLIPLYTKFMPLEAMFGMVNMFQDAVVDLQTFVLYAIAPFNIFKGVLVSVLGYFVYIALKPLLLKELRI